MYPSVLKDCRPDDECLGERAVARLHARDWQCRKGSIHELAQPSGLDQGVEKRQAVHGIVIWRAVCDD